MGCPINWPQEGVLVLPGGIHMRRSHPLALALGLLLTGPGGAAAREGVTLEQLLGSPFPTSLVAAPAGGKVAWVFNDRGRRNIWIAEPAGRGTRASGSGHP